MLIEVLQIGSLGSDDTDVTDLLQAFQSFLYATIELEEDRIDYDALRQS